MEILFTPEQAGNKDITAEIVQAVDKLQQAGGGTLRFAAGTYPVGPFSLCSGMTLVLEKGAILQFSDDPARYPLVECQFEGRLEQRPAPCVSVRKAERVRIMGEGILDGGGAVWWRGHRSGTLPHGRPFLFHAEDCRDLQLEGVTFRNSPTRTIHPLRCTDVRICHVTVWNPADSPNTDGVDPESCRGVDIRDCTIDVGDDCIAIKAGNEGTRPQVPCEDIRIAGCRLLHGHGGVVIGSEMSGGVRNVRVEDCLFDGTDRGIRIKTRRRRGGLVDGVAARNLQMKNVLSPLVINMFYGCDPGPEEGYIWDTAPYPRREDTPEIGNIQIQGLTAEGVTACAAFVWGLPESPVRSVRLQDCRIVLAPEQSKEPPAMIYGLKPLPDRKINVRNADFCQENVVVETESPRKG